MNMDDDSIYNAIVSKWQDILKKIRSENAGLQAIIRECQIVSVKNKKAIFQNKSIKEFFSIIANKKNRYGVVF